MNSQCVYIICAKDEEAYAELLAAPLRDAGYEVVHNGTVKVGDSEIREAESAVASGRPVVVCATIKAMGTGLPNKITNAAHGRASSRVFMVQMERDAYIDQLRLDGKVARYCDNPAEAIDELLEALAIYFPPSKPSTGQSADLPPNNGLHCLDLLTDKTTFDIEALEEFRAGLRSDFLDEYPTSLTAWEFLDRAGLWAEGRLTRLGVLLFGKNPNADLPAAIVKCTQYNGNDRSARRDIRTFSGTVTTQVVSARDFVADRVNNGEVPSDDQAQAATTYDYPMVAVREIIANAIVHRDYALSEAHVAVRLFSDRLEVTSPGAWSSQPLAPDVEYSLSSLEGQSKKRNMRLAHVVSGIRLVEGDGSGIPSALKACERFGCPNPVVTQDSGGFVTVVLRRTEPKESVIAFRAPGFRVSALKTVDHRLWEFRDRTNELETVIHSLGNINGPHFWLLTAPPQLGKSWFLRRVANDSNLGDWQINLVDLRDLPVETRADPAAILALLLGTEPLSDIGPDTPRRLVRHVMSRARKPLLCLLDSAELLKPQAATAIRSCLSKVYRLMQDFASRNIRLAVIVASGREVEEWLGVTPAPRMSRLLLSEFDENVAYLALLDLGEAMSLDLRAVDLRHYALRIQRVTNGMPALLMACLNWIRDAGWLDLELLESEAVFEELAGPYVQDILLGHLSLFPNLQMHDDRALHTLAQAMRVLTPYRLFTRSHLKHYLQFDQSLAAVTREQRWSVEDLHKAISSTTLLKRPLDEPWQEIYPPIRRLLYRHYYRSPELQLQAHTQARDFMAGWADRPSGSEQSICLVEYLWHEAMLLRLRDTAELGEDLVRVAQNLTEKLRPTFMYTVSELRNYAAERMRNDEEFEDAVSAAQGLFERLIDIVKDPG